MTSLTIPLIVFTCLIVVVLHLISQRIKLSKEEARLKAQDKKIEEMINKQNNSNHYQDFTEGHLYQ